MLGPSREEISHDASGLRRSKLLASPVLSETSPLAELIHLALADAVIRFIDLGPSAYGRVENDSISAEELDITVWFEGRAPPATGQVLESSNARSRDELEHPAEPTIVIMAERGVALVYAGAEFAYSVAHPRPSFFDDLLNREVPQHDPPHHYFGWH